MSAYSDPAVEAQLVQAQQLMQKQMVPQRIPSQASPYQHYINPAQQQPPLQPSLHSSHMQQHSQQWQQSAYPSHAHMSAHDAHMRKHSAPEFASHRAPLHSPKSSSLAGGARPTTPTRFNALTLTTPMGLSHTMDSLVASVAKNRADPPHINGAFSSFTAQRSRDHMAQLQAIAAESALAGPLPIQSTPLSPSVQPIASRTPVAENSAAQKAAQALQALKKKKLTGGSSSQVSTPKSSRGMNGNHAIVPPIAPFPSALTLTVSSPSFGSQPRTSGDSDEKYSSAFNSPFAARSTPNASPIASNVGLGSRVPSSVAPLQPQPSAFNRFKHAPTPSKLLASGPSPFNSFGSKDPNAAAIQHAFQNANDVSLFNNESSPHAAAYVGVDAHDPHYRAVSREGANTPHFDVQIVEVDPPQQHHHHHSSAAASQSQTRRPSLHALTSHRSIAAAHEAAPAVAQQHSQAHPHPSPSSSSSAAKPHGSSLQVPSVSGSPQTSKPTSASHSPMQSAAHSPMQSPGLKASTPSSAADVAALSLDTTDDAIVPAATPVDLNSATARRKRIEAIRAREGLTGGYVESIRVEGEHVSPSPPPPASEIHERLNASDTTAPSPTFASTNSTSSHSSHVPKKLSLDDESKDGDLFASYVDSRGRMVFSPASDSQLSALSPTAKALRSNNGSATAAMAQRKMMAGVDKHLLIGAAGTKVSSAMYSPPLTTAPFAAHATVTSTFHRPKYTLTDKTSPMLLQIHESINDTIATAGLLNPNPNNSVSGGDADASFSAGYTVNHSYLATSDLTSPSAPHHHGHSSSAPIWPVRDINNSFLPPPPQAQRPPPVEEEEDTTATAAVIDSEGNVVSIPLNLLQPEEKSESTTVPHSHRHSVSALPTFPGAEGNLRSAATSPRSHHHALVTAHGVDALVGTSHNRLDVNAANFLASNSRSGTLNPRTGKLQPAATTNDKVMISASTSMGPSLAPSRIATAHPSRAASRAISTAASPTISPRRAAASTSTAASIRNTLTTASISTGTGTRTHGNATPIETDVTIKEIVNPARASASHPSPASLHELESLMLAQSLSAAFKETEQTEARFRAERLARSQAADAMLEKILNGGGSGNTSNSSMAHNLHGLSVMTDMNKDAAYHFQTEMLAANARQAGLDSLSPSPAESPSRHGGLDQSYTYSPTHSATASAAVSSRLHVIHPSEASADVLTPEKGSTAPRTTDSTAAALAVYISTPSARPSARMVTDTALHLLPSLPPSSSPSVHQSRAVSRVGSRVVSRATSPRSKLLLSPSNVVTRGSAPYQEKELSMLPSLPPSVVPSARGSGASSVAHSSRIENTNNTPSILTSLSSSVVPELKEEEPESITARAQADAIAASAALVAAAQAEARARRAAGEMELARIRKEEGEARERQMRELEAKAQLEEQQLLRIQLEKEADARRLEQAERMRVEADERAAKARAEQLAAEAKAAHEAHVAAVEREAVAAAEAQVKRETDERIAKELADAEERARLAAREAEEQLKARQAEKKAQAELQEKIDAHLAEQVEQKYDEMETDGPVTSGRFDYDYEDGSQHQQQQQHHHPHESIISPVPFTVPHGHNHHNLSVALDPALVSQLALEAEEMVGTDRHFDEDSIQPLPVGSNALNPTIEPSHLIRDPLNWESGVTATSKHASKGPSVQTSAHGSAYASAHASAQASAQASKQHSVRATPINLSPRTASSSSSVTTSAAASPLRTGLPAPTVSQHTEQKIVASAPIAVIDESPAQAIRTIAPEEPAAKSSIEPQPIAVPDTEPVETTTVPAVTDTGSTTTNTTSSQSSTVTSEPTAATAVEPAAEPTAVADVFPIPAVVLHSFNATVAGQISMTRGDKVHVVEKPHFGWWTVINLRTEAHGHVPSNFLKVEPATK